MDYGGQTNAAGKGMSLLKNIFGSLWGSKKQPVSSVINIYSEYCRLANLQGIDQPYLFLSFDCDTDLDAEIVEDVHNFLQELGILATYAVPGAQLNRSPEPYRRLAARGAEFINHGGLPHAKWNGDQWVGITFYGDMKPEDVCADIRLGHDIVCDVIGKLPIGFRAPHFGSYQNPEQLSLIYSTTKQLGYKYCSTTMPEFALKRGPAYIVDGIYEFPCFGSSQNPETILDSWTYLVDKKNYSLGNQYQNLMDETTQNFLKYDIPAVFTWYGDPCHVHGQLPFMQAMKNLAALGIKSVNGQELLEIVQRAG